MGSNKIGMKKSSHKGEHTNSSSANGGEQSYHVPVLLNEVLDLLNINPEGIYVDCTFGGGGHSNAILQKLNEKGKLVAFDRSAHFNARLQSATSGTGPVEKEWYLYYKPEAQLVFYDATMQGGMFLDDKGPLTSLPKRWLISNHFGGVYSTDALTFKIQYFFNTKESDQSLFRHQYGSLAMAYRF